MGAGEETEEEEVRPAPDVLRGAEVDAVVVVTEAEEGPVGLGGRIEVDMVSLLARSSEP